MTFEELLEQARTANAAYRQYDRKLRDENCIRRVAKKRVSRRGRAWFEKGQAVLQVGKPEDRSDIGLPGKYVTIWSPSAESFCLAPEASFF
jgi:hypothetical protein